MIGLKNTIGHAVPSINFLSQNPLHTVPVLNFLAGEVAENDSIAYTSSVLNIGPEEASRYIIVCVVGKKLGATNIIESVNIGGVSATEVISQDNLTNNATICAIYMAHIPTGTTAQINVNFADQQLRVSWQAYKVTSKNNLNAFDTGANIAANDPTMSVNVPQDGLTIASAYSDRDGVCNWTGLIEDYDAEVEGRAISSASQSNMNAESGRTVIADFYDGGSNESVGVVASFL